MGIHYQFAIRFITVKDIAKVDEKIIASTDDKDNDDDFTDYLTKANAEVCLLLQVESRAGLDALSEIVNTAGVDGVFIGPADLAASLGYLGQPAHPEVKAIIEQALKTIRAAGKAAGILATDKALAEHYRGCGAQFIAIGVDTLVLANGASALAASVKGDLAAPEPGNGGY